MNENWFSNRLLTESLWKGISVTEKVVLKIKLTKRQKHWHLNMTDLFTRRRGIPSYPWIKQGHLGKCSNGKLHTSTLVRNGSLRSTQSTAYFASALSNVNNVKVSDPLEFIVMLLLSSFCSHPEIICRKLQDYGNIHGWDSFLIT